MSTLKCQRCTIEPPRYEIMDRKTGQITLLCELCLLQTALSASEETKRELEAEDKARRESQKQHPSGQKPPKTLPKEQK